VLEAYLISAGTKSTVLLAAGGILYRCLQRQSASARHLVCLTALGSAALAPLVALWSPHWSVAITLPVGLGRGLGHSAGVPHLSWSAILAWLWALGALAMAIRAAGGWLILRRARRSSIHFMQGEAEEVRIGNVSTPLTCGVVKPLIILPENAREWDATRLRAVLLHESAHVRRRDCLAKHMVQAARALLWWNPLARMMSTRADREQERACDDAVLSAGVAPEDYAKALLDTARECSTPLLLGCAMSDSSVLRARLEHLFAWRPEVRRATRRTALAIPLLLALMTGVSCAGKRYPQASILSGTNLVQYLHNARPRSHK
jgi:beta-lactamase regulating signal transducer with metallopeptidase domain